MKKNALSVALVVQLLFCSSVFAAEWNSCADELDRLEQVASEAADAARDVDSKADDYDQCKLMPITDLWNDGCRTRASGYTYELSHLQKVFEAMNTRIRSVGGSCSVPVSR